MSRLFRRRLPVIAASLAILLLLAACGGGGVKPDSIAPAADVPKSFDVTLVADKDGQFDFDGAPLTAQDLTSALRYRKDEKLPMATVLLKRGDSEKIKNTHIVALARIAFELGFRAWMLDDGTYSEVRAVLKNPASGEGKGGSDKPKDTEGKP